MLAGISYFLNTVLTWCMCVRYTHEIHVNVAKERSGVFLQLVIISL